MFLKKLLEKRNPAPLGAVAVQQTPPPQAGRTPVAKDRELASFSQVLSLQPGLYEVRHRGMKPGVKPSLDTFAVLLPMDEKSKTVKFIDEANHAAIRLGKVDDAAFISVAPGGGQVILTTYGESGSQQATIDIALRQLKDHERGDNNQVSGNQVSGNQGHDRGLAPLLSGFGHVQNMGDTDFSASEWIGYPDRSLRLEGFRLTLDEPSAQKIKLEYAADSQVEGALVGWVPMGAYCGSRGQAQALRRLAIRLAGQGQNSIFYQAAFSDGSQGPVLRDGQIVQPTSPESHIVAFRAVIKDKAISADLSVFSS